MRETHGSKSILKRAPHFVRGYSSLVPSGQKEKLFLLSHIKT